MLPYHAAEQSPPSPLSDIGVVALSRNCAARRLLSSEGQSLCIPSQKGHFICKTAGSAKLGGLEGDGELNVGENVWQEEG